MTVQTILIGAGGWSDFITIGGSLGALQAGAFFDQPSGLWGSTISQTTFRLRKLGTPTGFAVAKIIRTSNGSLVATSTNNLDVATLPPGKPGFLVNDQNAGWVDVTFSFNSALAPNEQFAIVVEFVSTSNNNIIRLGGLLNASYAPNGGLIFLTDSYKFSDAHTPTMTIVADIAAPPPPPPPPPGQFTLTIDAKDMSGASIAPTIDIIDSLGVPHSGQAPLMITLPAGNTTITAINSLVDFTFEHWSDGFTGNPRQITLSADTSLTAFYVNNQQPPPPPGNGGLGGLAIFGGALAVLALLLRKSK